MSRKTSSIKGNVAWSLVGQAGHAGLQWGVLVVIAQLAGPSRLGEFALALAITGPIFMFFSGQLTFSQATDAKHEYSLADYFSARLLGALLGLFCSAFLGILAFPESSVSITLIALAKSFELIGEIGQGSLQGRERFRTSSILLLTRGGLGLLGVSAGTLLSDQSWSPAVGYAIGRGIAATAEASGTLWGSRLSLQVHRTRQLLVATLPLSFSSLIIALQASAPRLILERLHGTEELGIYAAVAYLSVVGNTAVQATVSSLGPRMARAYHESNPKALKLLMGGAIALAAIVGALGVLFAGTTDDLLLVLLYGEGFAHTGTLFTIVMTTAALGYISTAIRQILVSLRRIRYQVRLLSVSLGLRVLLLIFLVPKFGSIGAAWAGLFGSVFQLAAFLALLASHRGLSSKGALRAST